MDNEVKLTCKAVIENEVMLRHMVGLFISSANPTLDELTEVKTIMSEALINAIIHGYEGRNDGEIRVQLFLKQNTLTMIIEDDGCGIEDLEKAKEPLYTTKPELERSGMGMTIMESLADEFDIQSKPNQGCKVRMVKHFRAHQ